MPAGYRHRRRQTHEVETEASTDAQLEPVERVNGRGRRDSDASQHDVEDQSSTAANKSNIPEADVQLMVKNFVRLALACENIRSSIKREDISKKVFVNDHKRCFPLVFERTQERLRSTFGMELIELPARDRTRNMSMTQQRKAAHTQASTASTQVAAKPSKSWVLRNVLPPEMKQISQRQHRESERNYNAVITIALILVVMSDEQCCSENRAISAFERLGWHPITPAGPFDEVVSKMTKQGYIERVKDDQSQDATYNLYVGPRGKLETLQNQDEMFSIISKIYGHDGDEAARERLQRIVQDTLEVEDEVLEDGDDEPETDNMVETQLPAVRSNGQEHSDRAKKKQRRHRDADDQD